MAGLNDLITDAGSLKTPTLDGSIGGSSNKELMAEARMALSGNWGMAILGYVLYFVLVMSFSMFWLSHCVFQVLNVQVKYQIRVIIIINVFAFMIYCLVF